jgi:hypothetical protein
MSDSPLKHLFNDKIPPPIDLIDTVQILGFSVTALRSILYLDMLLHEIYEGNLEPIVQIPSEKLDEFSGYKKRITILSNENRSKLEKCYKPPQFYSNIITIKETALIIYFHGLIVYEKVTPAIVEQSRNRTLNNFNYGFVATETTEEEFYTPIVIGIYTRSSYFDAFRDVLSALYQILLESYENSDKRLGQIASSFEFYKLSYFLLYKTIIPPYDIKLSLHLGSRSIDLPTDRYSGLPHNESCIAVLMDLIDIDKIIKIWEGIILNTHTAILSSNEPLLFSLVEAFKMLTFPVPYILGVFHVTSACCKDFLDSPTPYLAGVNSAIANFKECVRAFENLNVFDLDSNTLLTRETSLLCGCAKRPIYYKLKLAKTYYYVDPDRIEEYQLTMVEEFVNDTEFVSKAREMIGITDRVEKTQCFISLVRQAFLGFFRLVKAADYFMELQSGSSFFDLNKRKFIDSVELCNGEKCKMSKFWENFLESQTVNMLFSYYKKFDNNYQQRYREIIDLSQYQVEDENGFKLHLYQQGRTLDLLQTLMKENMEKQPKSSEEGFKLNSFKIMANEILEILLKNPGFYDSSLAFNKRQGTIGRNIIPLNKTDPKCNMFYGEFGILRFYNVLFYDISDENLLNYWDSLENPDFNMQTWEGVLLKLMFCLKTDKDLKQAELALEIILKLNSINDKRLPSHHVGRVIEKIHNIDASKLEALCRVKGFLGKLARQYLTLYDSPGEVSRMNSDGTLGQTVAYARNSSFRNMSEDCEEFS